MANQTKALTKTNDKVTETKSLPMYDKSALASARKNSHATQSVTKSEQKNSTSALKTPDIYEFDAGEVDPKSKLKPPQSNNNPLSSLTIFVGSFVSIAIVGVLAVVFIPSYVVPTYKNYMAKSKSGQKNALLLEKKPERTSTHFYSNAEMTDIVAQVNKTLPKMIDKDTRLDSAIGVPDAIQYNYTLVRTGADNISWEAFKTTVEKSLVQWVCTTKQLAESFIERGVSVSFAYFGNDRRLIGVVTVEPTQCLAKAT